MPTGTVESLSVVIVFMLAFSFRTLSGFYLGKATDGLNSGRFKPH